MSIDDKPKRTYGRNGQHNVLVFYGKQGAHEHYWYNAKTGQMGWHGDEVEPDLKKASGQDGARNAKPIAKIIIRRNEQMATTTHRKAIVTLNPAAAQAHEDFATVFGTAARDLEEDGKGVKAQFQKIYEDLGPYAEEYGTLLDQMIEAGNLCVELMRTEERQLRDSADWIRQPAGTPRPVPKSF